MDRKSFKRGVLAIAFCFTVVMAMISGCAAGQKAPTSAPKPTPAAEIKPIVLKYAEYSPQGKGRVEALTIYADEIEKRTGGRVKIEIYWAESIAKSANILEAVRTGMADMGTINCMSSPGPTPLSMIGSFNYASSDPGVMSHTMYELWQTSPAFYAEYMKWNMRQIWPMGTESSNVETKQPKKTLQELKGLKIRAAGWSIPGILTKLGVSVITMGPGDVYDALAKGVLDGGHASSDTSLRYNWYEVAPYMLMTEFGANAVSIPAINLDVWKKLPDDIKKVFDDLNAEMPDVVGRTFKEYAVESEQSMKSKGVQFFPLSAEDQKTVRAAALPLWDEYAKQLEDKGLPGNEALAKFKVALKKYEQAK